MDFIVATSNLRAANYSIPPADRHKVLLNLAATLVTTFWVSVAESPELWTWNPGSNRPLLSVSWFVTWPSRVELHGHSNCYLVSTEVLKVIYFFVVIIISHFPLAWSPVVICKLVWQKVHGPVVQRWINRYAVWIRVSKINQTIHWIVIYLVIWTTRAR